MNSALELRVKRHPVPVDLSVLPSVDHIGHACAKCAEFGRCNDKVVALETGIDPAVWSRIKAGDAGVKFDFLERLMDACGNEFPLIWIAWKRGFDLSRRESELERENRELRDLLEKERAEKQVIKEFVKEIRAV